MIDWLIRKHPDQTAVRNSKIEDGYETTNIWKIHPAHCKEHPAILPIELAEKVIKYYSFEHDVILDPFGGIGTTGKAAKKMGRRFVLFEKESQYIQRIKKDVRDWFIGDDFDINWINVDVNKNEFNNIFSRL